MTKGHESANPTEAQLPRVLLFKRGKKTLHLVAISNDLGHDLKVYLRSRAAVSTHSSNITFLKIKTNPTYKKKKGGN